MIFTTISYSFSALLFFLGNKLIIIEYLMESTANLSTSEHTNIKHDHEMKSVSTGGGPGLIHSTNADDVGEYAHSDNGHEVIS
jgi:hypothetical protein